MLSAIVMSSTTPCGLAVLGHEHDAGPDRGQRVAEPQRLALDADRARRPRGPRRRSPARARCGPRRRSPRCRGSRPARTENDTSRNAVVRSDHSTCRTSSDPGSSAAGNSRSRLRPTMSSISCDTGTCAVSCEATQRPSAQHHDAIGDPRDLLEPVRDVDERDALGAQLRRSPRTGARSPRRPAPRSARRAAAASRPASAPWRSRPAAARRRAASAPCRSGGMSSPSRCSCAAARAFICSRSMRPPFIGQRPMKTFSATERSGSSRSSWWIIPMPAAIASPGSAGA